LSLCGYYPQDLLLEPDFIERQQVALERVLAVSRHCDAHLVVGAGDPPRRPGQAAAQFAGADPPRRGAAHYHKQLLPTYNIFDERRHFEPGGRHAAVRTSAAGRWAF
jgi:predicted amidohydrolase